MSFPEFTVVMHLERSVTVGVIQRAYYFLLSAF